MLGIALDIDGTLVDMEGCLFPSTAKTLTEHWSGAHIILASARPPQGIQYILDQLGRDGPYIALNGALISPGRGQSLLAGNPVPADVLGIVHNVVLSKRGISALFIYDTEHWYAWGDKAAIAQERVLTSATPVVIQEPLLFQPASVLKLLVACNDEDAWNNFYELLREKASESCTVRQSRPYYIELTAAGVTKGAGLGTCRRLFGLDRCIAVGDGLNDLDMFHSADISYAAPAAPAELKRQATYVLDMPHDNSLAELLYNLLTTNVIERRAK